MSYPKFPRVLKKWFTKFGTHVMALLLGGALTFGALQSIAAPGRSLTLSREGQTLAMVPPAAMTPDSFVAAAVARTGGAVVRLDTQKTVTARSTEPFMDDPFFREFFGDRIAPAPQRQVVTGQGSGFITDSNGTILTNAHVISGADRVTVTLRDGRTFPGQVKGVDSVTDLAVVKIEPKGDKLPVAPLGNSDALQVGDWAIAVGNPVGLNNTVTLGIISTLSRPSSQAGIPDKRIDFLQTDAAINPGNSGGPLLNAKGEVIGINTAIRTDAMGIGFAIPINKAKSLEGELAAGRKVAHPYVGIQMVGLTPEMARENNRDPNTTMVLPEVEGVLVVRVMRDTPAERAGLRRGDVILQVDNQRVTDAGQLQNMVEKSGINQTLNFQVQRGGDRLEFKVTTAQMANQASDDDQP